MTGWGKLDWGNWLYGLFAGFIGGGATSVTNGIAASLIDPQAFTLGGRKFFSLVGMTFLVSGTISGFLFLKQNPLPKEITDAQAQKPAGEIQSRQAGA